jgi:hypothetical protein
LRCDNLGPSCGHGHGAHRGAQQRGGRNQAD